MIKNIIFVEDGSVDVNELTEKLTSDTQVIIYRQGAMIPKIEILSEPINTVNDIDEQLTKRKYNELCIRCTDLLNEIYMDKSSTKRTKKRIETFIVNYLG